VQVIEDCLRVMREITREAVSLSCYEHSLLMLKTDTELPGTLKRKYVTLTSLKLYTTIYKWDHGIFQVVNNRFGTAEVQFQFQGIRV